MADKGISGTGITAATTGILFLWSAVKGTSPVQTLRELISGEAPSGTNVHPIDASAKGDTGGSAPSADATGIVAAAAAKKGQPYRFGGGHSGNPCAASATDCSSFVSCAINTATGTHINMATGGLAKYGTGVSYAQRAPGDIIVWNGGTGGGHCGVIASVDGKGGTMWHNPCTSCGGVQLGRYPYGSRSAASSVVRRVTRR